jgi:hypothetical protein
MTQYHAVMLDETGCEFGATVVAVDRAGAYAALAEDYPESRCVQLESPEDTAARERAMYDRIAREMDDDYDTDVDDGEEW